MTEAYKFKKYLELALKEPLPGFDYQMRMAPKIDLQAARSFKPTKDAKRSAVLVLITPDENGNPRLLLTLRSKHLKKHSGQISFPGGKSDEGETPEETALRESNEETGLAYELPEIIGRMSELFVPPSNSVITPVVAYAETCGKLEANIDEVSEILFVNIDQIAGDDKILFFESDFGSKVIKYPYWEVHPTTKLWGATAILISELLELYYRFRNMEDNIN